MFSAVHFSTVFRGCICKYVSYSNQEVCVVEDVGGKVIHLVERAPPPPSQSNSGTGGSSADSGTASSSQGPSTMPPHDRNANSYVMLGTFNLPVNIMDPQQIQVCELRCAHFVTFGSGWKTKVNLFITQNEHKKRLIGLIESTTERF